MNDSAPTEAGVCDQVSWYRDSRLEDGLRALAEQAVVLSDLEVAEHFALTCKTKIRLAGVGRQAESQALDLGQIGDLTIDSNCATSTLAEAAAMDRPVHTVIQR